MNLTEHFSLEEVTHSDTAARRGIDNSLPPELLPVVTKTATRTEKVRAVLGKPISITSWYRSLPLNRALLSADTSQHPKGEAVDFICPSFGTPLEVCKFLIKNRDLIRWDQLILEHTWVHISWNSIPSGEQRGQVLSLLETGKYATGLTDKKGNPL
jgi:zinc D-Ala-D-Ala carboxypeptidase